MKKESKKQAEKIDNGDEKLLLSDVSVRFPMTKIGANEAGEYLVNIDRMKDFWAGHPSSHDIINYANKLWSELNAH